MTRIDIEALAELLAGKAEGGARVLAGIAGPPGVGKSTSCEHLLERLNAGRPGFAAILPMDGYHLDDAVLEARGQRMRKGAPFTFDLGGFAAMIARLKADDGSDIAVPVFDRAIEIARAGGRIIESSTRILVVEGNYLLLDAPGWRDLKALFDTTVLLKADESVLEERLLSRWRSYGLPDAVVREKTEGNDLPNMRLVLRESLDADHWLATDGN